MEINVPRNYRNLISEVLKEAEKAFYKAYHNTTNNQALGLLEIAIRRLYPSFLKEGFALTSA